MSKLTPMEQCDNWAMGRISSGDCASAVERNLPAYLALVVQVAQQYQWTEGTGEIHSYLRSHEQVLAEADRRWREQP